MIKFTSPGKVFLFSVGLNIFLLLLLLNQAIVGCSEVADGKMGVLKRDVDVGLFGKNDVIFTLPKGLSVLDAHATGADHFEPNRFRIIVTSNESDLVDYSSEEVAHKFNPHGNYYSAKKEKK